MTAPFMVTEWCGCGAHITVTGPESAAVQNEIAQFRRNHRHMVRLFQADAQTPEPKEVTK